MTSPPMPSTPPSASTTREHVLLTNVTYQVISRLPWTKAVTLVVTDQADVLESNPDDLIHSAGGLTIACPTIIRQRSYIRPHMFVSVTSRENPTKMSILYRDDFTCAYCGTDNATTVDHIFPRSRGGKNTWDNLVACCDTCNNRKRARTPLEWGHELLYLPYCPSHRDPRETAPQRASYEKHQQRVWDALENMTAS